MRWQTGTVTEIVRRSPTVSSFFFRLPEFVPFIAGQHVSVRLTAPDGYRAQRSYSIVSAPETTSHIELAIERLENGEVSPFFHEVVEVGDEIELSMPIGGHFIWRTRDGGPVLLIGGGAGVAPFVSMARHRALSRLDRAHAASVFGADAAGSALHRGARATARTATTASTWSQR